MADISLERGQIVITSPKSTVEVRKLPTILLRRRWQILGVSCVVMSVASLTGFMTKSTYQSSMQILVSSNTSEELRSSHLQESSDSKFINPQLEVNYTSQPNLILSSRLIQKALDLLHTEYPDIKLEDIKGKNQQKPLVVNKVEGNTEDKNTQVFEISFQGDDPVKVQKILQTLQKVYFDYKIDQQKERLFKGIEFINQRLPKVKKEMFQAEKKLEQFRKKNNLLDPEVQGKILLESLADVKKHLRITRAQLEDAQTRYNNLKKELDFLPQNTLISSLLSQSTRYQTLLNEIQKTDLALEQERLRYTDNSPVVQKLIQQHQNQMTLLREEMEQVLGDKAVEALSDNEIKTKQLRLEELDSTKELLLLPEYRAKNELKLDEELIQVQTTALGLRANEKSLTASEAQLRSELSKYPSLIAEYNRLLPEVETHRKTLKQLMSAQQYLGLMIAQGGLDLQVLEEPQQGTYLGSNRFLIILLGALFGPLLGVTTALISETLNKTISSPEELQKLSNLRLVGTVPKLRFFSTKKGLFRLPFMMQRILVGSSLKAVSNEHPLSVYSVLPEHETLDIAYQNIQLKSSPCKSLMLTSAIQGEGKSTVALGLAVSAARRNQRVLVIDANLREPNLHKILGLSNDWGLSLLLVEETNTSVQEYIQPIHPSIDVLTAGPKPEDTVKLLSSERMKELLEFFEQNYDLVLIDTSPILGIVDGRIVASICNGIVMVGRIGRVTPVELSTATEILSNLNLLGIIANEATA